MKTNRNKFKNKKGITIVEVVIALVLIGVVMASAISVIMMSIQIEKNSSSAVQLQTAAENILECFRFAETEEEFAEAISKCGDYQKAEDGSYLLSGIDFIITIKTDFTENKLEFSATDSKGDEIYSFNYPNSVEAAESLSADKLRTETDVMVNNRTATTISASFKAGSEATLDITSGEYSLTKGEII